MDAEAHGKQHAHTPVVMSIRWRRYFWQRTYTSKHPCLTLFRVHTSSDLRPPDDGGPMEANQKTQ
jgi:hypothetical protein